MKVWDINLCQNVQYCLKVNICLVSSLFLLVATSVKNEFFLNPRPPPKKPDLYGEKDNKPGAIHGTQSHIV